MKPNKYLIIGGVAVTGVLAGNYLTNAIAQNTVHDKVTEINQGLTNGKLTVGEVSRGLFAGVTTIENIKFTENAVAVEISKVLVSQSSEQQFDVLSLSDIKVSMLDASLTIKSADAKDLDLELLQSQFVAQSEVMGIVATNLMTVFQSNNRQAQQRAVAKLQKAQSDLMNNDVLLKNAFKSMNIVDAEVTVPLYDFQIKVGELFTEYGDDLVMSIPESANFGVKNLIMDAPRELKRSHPLFGQIFANKPIDFSLGGSYSFADDVFQSSLTFSEESLAKFSFDYEFGNFDIDDAQSFFALIDNPNTDPAKIIDHPVMKNLSLDKLGFSVEENGAIKKMLAPFTVEPAMLQQQIDALAMEADKLQPGLGEALKHKLTLFVNNPSSLSFSVSQKPNTQLGQMFVTAQQDPSQVASLVQSFTFSID